MLKEMCTEATSDGMLKETSMALHDGMSKEMSMALRVRVVEANDEFRALQSQWTELLDHCGHASPFLSWEWMWAWWSIFSRGKRLYILLVVDDTERLVGIAPFYINQGINLGFFRYRELRFVGTGERSSPEFLNIIAEQGAEQQVTAAIVDHLRRSSDWEGMRLTDLTQDSFTLQAVQEAAHVYGYRVLTRVAAICPYQPLPATWEGYLAQLSSRTRRRFKKQITQCIETPGCQFIRWEQERELHTGIVELARLHNLSVGQRTRGHSFSDPRCLPFLQLAASLLHDINCTRLYTMEYDGIPIAMLFCFYYKGKLYGYRTGYDLQFAEQKVGTVCMLLSIKAGLEEGAEVLEMCKGKYQYKAALVNCEHTSYECLVFAKGSLNTIPFLAYRTKFWLKRHIPALMKELCRRIRSCKQSQQPEGE